MNSPQPSLTVASILTGFCISVFMFHTQRELSVRDHHPDWPNWLAWADYLIMATIVLSVLLVILPLVAVPAPGRVVYSIVPQPPSWCSPFPSPFSITIVSRSVPGAPSTARVQTCATKASQVSVGSW